MTPAARKETEPWRNVPAKDFAGQFWLGALLAGAIVLAYLPCLRGGMQWDDDRHVTRPALRSLAGLGKIWFQPGATQQYYPLLHSAFWVEHRLWGDAPLGYHLTNLLCHALSAFLLVAILRRLAVPGAWLAGFIFALHPVEVESVAWISEQKNALSGLLYFAAALTYLRVERPDPRTLGDAAGSQRQSALGSARSTYLLATLLFVLALLTKSVTATLPAALLVVLWWKRGRLSWSGDVAPLTPWLILGAGAGLGTAWVERHLVGAKGIPYLLSGGQRLALAGRALWFYLGKTLWPAHLTFIYPRWTIDSTAVGRFIPLLAALAVLAGLWIVAHRQGRRGALAGALFFVGTLIPALGFFDIYPFRYSYVADHFQYLACLGVIVPAAAGLARTGNRVAPAVLVAVLGILTWRQAALYRSAEGLYRATLERNPSCWMAENNLGEILSKERGRLPEAIAHFQASLALNPAHPEAENNLGVALLETGQPEEGIRHYRTAVALNPDYAEAHNNLGNALLGQGEAAEAAGEFETALRLDAGLAEAHNNLGNILQQTGHIDEAIGHYQTALRINPDYFDAHNDLAAALVRSGRARAAVAEFQAALRLRPGDSTAAENLRRLEVYLQSRR